VVVLILKFLTTLRQNVSIFFKNRCCDYFLAGISEFLVKIVKVFAILGRKYVVTQPCHGSLESVFNIYHDILACQFNEVTAYINIMQYYSDYIRAEHVCTCSGKTL
jgi:hypothetical protein